MKIIREIKPRDEPRDGFANDTEREFAELLDSWGIAWEHEPHFYYGDDPNRPPGDSPRGYRPDFWLCELGIYVEIYANERWSRDHKLVGKKTHKIRWLSTYTNEAALLLSKRNWPKNLEDFLYLVRRSTIGATLEHYEPSNPTISL